MKPYMENPLPKLTLQQATAFLQYYHIMTGTLLANVEQIENALEEKKRPMTQRDWYLVNLIESKLDNEVLVLHYALLHLLKHHSGIRII